MQDAMTVFMRQSIKQRTLIGGHGMFINKTPIAFVESKRLLTGDRIMGIAIPCDQPELGEIPYDEGVGFSFHETSMHHAGFIFKHG